MRACRTAYTAGRSRDPDGGNNARVQAAVAATSLIRLAMARRQKTASTTMAVTTVTMITALYAVWARVDSSVASVALPVLR